MHHVNPRIVCGVTSCLGPDRILARITVEKQN